MKKIIALIFGVIFCLGCVDDKVANNKIFNPFLDIKSAESQYFNLDTIQLKEITGKYGTKIYFDRNSFNLKGSDKIILELKELYSIQDLITNNIRTITKENDLLESSGVIFINLTRNGEKLKLPDNSNIKVEFPLILSNQDKLFNGEVDSLGQISWSELESYFTVLKFDQKYQIDMPHDVILDSLPYYEELWRKEDSVYEKTFGRFDRIEKRVGTLLSFNKLGWTNVDKFVEEPSQMDFTFTNSLEVEGLVVYALYDNLNSFISYHPDETKDIVLNDVPVLEKTYFIVVGIKDGQLFAQKVLVNEKRTIELNLKNINQAELNKLFEK